jgi:hypothetical protein
MQLINVTMVILGVLATGGTKVRKVIRNPWVATLFGKPILPDCTRRLLTVQEVQRLGGGPDKCSRNRAQTLLRESPEAFCVPWEWENGKLLTGSKGGLKAAA